MIFEHRSQPPIPRRAFLVRLLRQIGYAAVLVAGSLVIGMAGYHWIAGFAWVDAFLDASMLLGGMGPVGTLPSSPAKIFAGMFALYAGLLFVVVSALFLTPILHRVMHHFHWEKKNARR